MQRHRLTFPPEPSTGFSQRDASFIVREDGVERRLKFHDYDEIFSRPGLYEQIFYDRLECNSPERVADNLVSVLDANGERTKGLRVLDLGAGNGIMGEELKKHHGVARLVGADIIQEAEDAAWRDRPHVYDDYVVADFTALDAATTEKLENWNFNCLTVVAALGFADIPVDAFLAAANLISDRGWLAINIKETFLDPGDESGFSRMVRKLMFSPQMEIHHLERYQHRLSMEGEPLFYYALIARKNGDLPLTLPD